MALTINVDRAPMLPLIAKAIGFLFHEPKSIFWTGKAMDMMFNGVPVDCTSSDFNAKATCSVFEGGEIKAVQPTDETDIFKFSLFGGVRIVFFTLISNKSILNLCRLMEAMTVMCSKLIGE